MAAGLRVRVRTLVGAGLLAALLAAPGAIAGSSPAPRLDPWTGWWVARDDACPPFCSADVWVLRQFADGAVVGWLMPLEGAVAPEEVVVGTVPDPEWLAFTGASDRSTGVATGTLSLPGDPSAALFPDPEERFRTFWLETGALVSGFVYAGGGPDRATVRLDWTKTNYRRGVRTTFPAYVGDVVRMRFDIENAGPRPVPSGLTSLVVVLPRAVGSGVNVRMPDNVICLRPDVRTTSVVVRCVVKALGPGSQEASVAIDVRVPRGLAGKVLRARARIATSATVSRSLDPPLEIDERPRRGALLSVAVKAGTPPPAGGGGGGAGPGGGGEPPAGPPPVGLPGPGVCLGNFVMETFTGAHVGVFLHRFVQESAYVFACVYKTIDDPQGGDWFVIRIDVTPPGLAGTAGDCSRTKDDERIFNPVVLYSEERYLTVSGGTRVSGAHAIGGDVPVIEETLERSEDDLVGAACP